MVVRKIQEFVTDDAGRPVAELVCGHRTTIGGDAPELMREWSRTEHGRKNLIGSLLVCPECTAGFPPVAHVHPSTKLDTRSSPHSFWTRPKARADLIYPD